jgi:hypothetical protein
MSSAGRVGQIGVIEDDTCLQLGCCPPTVWVEFETDNEDGPEPFPMSGLELLEDPV